MTPRRHPRYPFAAQWLAYALPCRRFADALAGACARLGADVGCYSFIAVDLHHLLLAGLPAHAFQSLALCPVADGCVACPRTELHLPSPRSWWHRRLMLALVLL